MILYFKQAWQILKENKLVSIVSVTGTALAIALVMVMFMIFQIKTANYPPEIGRDRTLLASVSSTPKEGMQGEKNNSAFPYELVKQRLYDLKSPEIVSVFSNNEECLLAIPTKRLYSNYRVKGTDVNFWKAFKFKFIEGRPFSIEEQHTGLPLVILSREAAQSLFIDESAVGQTIEINLKPYKVVGVVTDITRAASSAYAQAWVLLTGNPQYLFSKNENTVGPLTLMLLAKHKKDIPVIKTELEKVMKEHSDNNRQYNVIARTADIYQRSIGYSHNYLIQGLLVILFLLLLPALNLTGITMNNIRKRSSEIGIRKAFGATRGALMKQVLMENLFITAIGSLVGLFLSFIFIHISRSFLLTSDTLLTTEMLLRPANMIAAVVFCLLMNLLSAGIPAWRMSLKPIVNSLSGKNS